MKYPGKYRGSTLNPTEQLANDFEIERAVSYFADTPDGFGGGYDYRIDGGQLKLAGSRKPNGSLELYVQTGSDIAPLYRDFIAKQMLC